MGRAGCWSWGCEPWAAKGRGSLPPRFKQDRGLILSGNTWWLSLGAWWDELFRTVVLGEVPTVPGSAGVT